MQKTHHNIRRESFSRTPRTSEPFRKKNWPRLRASSPGCGRRWPPPRTSSRVCGRKDEALHAKRESSDRYGRVITSLNNELCEAWRYRDNAVAKHEIMNRMLPTTLGLIMAVPEDRPAADLAMRRSRDEAGEALRNLPVNRKEDRRFQPGISTPISKSASRPDIALGPFRYPADHENDPGKGAAHHRASGPAR